MSKNIILKISNKYPKYRYETFLGIAEYIDYLTDLAGDKRNIETADVIHNFPGFIFENHGFMSITYLRYINIISSNDLGKFIWILINEKMLKSTENDKIEDYNIDLDYIKSLESFCEERLEEISSI